MNGIEFYIGLTAGINNLLNYKTKLDEINVFHVPDGDTGTNMCFTLLPVIEECNNKITNNVGESLDIIADLALESARGNSGTIIAQFLHGVRKSFKNKDIINVNDFSKALISGYDSAIESLMKPEEGTIITVMRDVAEKSKELCLDEEISFEFFLDKCYQEAVISLEKTKNILKILKKSDVVDAGALGFVLLMQGWLNSVQKNTKIQSQHLNISYDHEKIESLKKILILLLKINFVQNVL